MTTSNSSGYSARHRALELVAIALYLAAALATAAFLATHPRLAEPSTWPWAALAVVTGIVAADLVSGVVHWMADSFGHEEMPILGEAFIRPFREHHVDPTGICRHDFVEVNGNNCVVILLFTPLVVIACSLVGPDVGLWILGWGWVYLAAIFGTNQFHSWAHAEQVPRPVRWLQDRGVILSPAHHDVHHTSPFDRYFCITCGWCNPLLDRLDVFGRLYRIFSRRPPAEQFLRQAPARPSEDP